MTQRTLQEKLSFYQAHKNKIDPLVLQKLEHAFSIENTHTSTAIEGNTLSLLETNLVVTEGLSVGGKKLREIFEVVNHDKAYRYVQDCIQQGLCLSLNLAKEIHALLMENILVGGIFRNENVRIAGAKHKPPFPFKMYEDLKFFEQDLPLKAESLEPIDLAAWTHAEFVRIHPFVDGNGRTSRLLMNFQLLRMNCPAVSFPVESKAEYFEALECYALTGELAPFVVYIEKFVEERLDEYIEIIEHSLNNIAQP
jgi:Fic family protein